MVGDAAGDHGPNTDKKCKLADKSCQSIIWVADSIVRDAVAEIRFRIGDKIAKGVYAKSDERKQKRNAKRRKQWKQKWKPY